MASAENIRFHAAGHLAAACLLASSGHIESARHILRVVAEYMAQPNVDSPPQLRASLAEYIKDPAANIDNIKAFEALFTGDENTHLERGNIRMGKGEAVTIQ